jgi:hypothetical protein
MSGLHEVKNRLLMLTIVHRETKEKRKLAVFSVYPKEIALRWPLYGIMRMNNRTGRGVGPAIDWTIATTDLERLHKEMAAIGIYSGTPAPKEAPKKLRVVKG